MGWHFRGKAVEVRQSEDRSVGILPNDIPIANADSLVPDSNVGIIERPPHDGEYIGMIEVVVLRCHSCDKRPVTGNATFSDESTDGNEPSTPGVSDGASDSRPLSEPKSKPVCRAQLFGLDGGWDDWGPPPPPLDEPSMGRIEMTSENTGIWNPVGQESTRSNALEKTTRWDKRSESRDHFQSDFQKRGSPAGSQRGRSDQFRSITDQEPAPSLNLRGEGPGSYSVASSEAMRNWNRGPPAQNEWTQKDAPSARNGGLPAAFDPWTANLPTGGFTNEAETKSQTEVGAWGTENETKNNPEIGKGSNKDSVVSRNHQNQGSNGDDWGIYRDTADGDDDWGGTGIANAQNNNERNGGGHQSQESNNNWNNDVGASSWDAPNNYTKKDDGAWDPPNNISNGDNDNWGGNEKNDTKKKGEWGPIEDKDPKRNDDWGATTGNDAQQGKDWGGDTAQQTDTWGGDDKKHVTTGAKDPEKGSQPTSFQQATRREKTRSTLSFGNSRAKGPKPASKAGSQSKPVSVNTKAASMASNNQPFTFDWLKPSLEKTIGASSPPFAVQKAFVPGVLASPVASVEKGAPKPVAPQIPPTFSISTPLKPKPYWQKWRNPNTTAEVEMEEEQALSLEEPEEPVYNISAAVAQRNMMSHQVRPGRPAPYTHRRNKPRYMDTHESPYAVFLFKYRGKEIIEHMLKTTVAEPEVDEKARLASLSKQELIDELMRTKSKLSLVESSSSEQATCVKKLDEKLSKLDIGEEEVPAIGDWVNTTSPTNGQGIGNVGGWGNNVTQKGKGRGGSGKGGDTRGDCGRNEVSNGHANGNGGERWDGNGSSMANGRSDWTNDGNGEASNRVEENGNGGTDWAATDQDNGRDENDDNGGSKNLNGGDGEWSNKNKNNDNNDKSADDWGNNNSNNGDTRVADDRGDNNKGSNAKEGGSWNNSWGRVDGGWCGNDSKKVEGNGSGDADGEKLWGADSSGGGGRRGRRERQGQQGRQGRDW